MLDMETRDFNLRDLLEETLDAMAESAHAKGLDLVAAVPVDLPAALRGDANRLRQILANLLGNAVKFTETGEVSIRVRALDESDNGVWFRFEVEDTGIGIAPEAQGRVMDAFAQADGSTTRKFGGTGLGLAICRKLTKLMGGKIGVRSAVGKGSTFWVEIPLAQQAEKSNYASEPRQDVSGLRALIVDDNATVRQALQDQLAFFGMRANGAENAQQALALLIRAAKEGNAYQLALLERHLTGIDGVELARQIGSDPHIAGTRIILLTLSGIDEAAAEPAKVGIGCCLAKPVRRLELSNALETAMSDTGELVSGTRGQAPLAGEPTPLLGVRIQLVEDDPVNREVASNLLELLGCRVDLAGNGEEALDGFSPDFYDLVLMDCHMPELDGFAATEEIRKRERTRLNGHHVPIVALTANVEKGIVARCRDAGMDDYLSKPFTREQLQTVLERWIERPISTGSAQERGFAEPAVPPEEQEGLLDQNVLDNIIRLQRPGKPDLLKKVIGLYLENAPKLLEGLQAGLAVNDVDALRAAAHGLKSSSANLGAVALEKTCADLETMALDGQLERVPEALALAENEFDRIQAKLETYTQQDTTS